MEGGQGGIEFPRRRKIPGQGRLTDRRQRLRRNIGCHGNHPHAARFHKFDVHAVFPAQQGEIVRHLSLKVLDARHGTRGFL